MRALLPRGPFRAPAMAKATSRKLLDYDSGVSSTAALGKVEFDWMGDTVRAGFSSCAANSKLDGPSPRAKLVSDGSSGAGVHCVGGHGLGDRSL